MYSFDALKLSSRAGLRVGMLLGWGMKRVQRLAEDSLCKRTALEARQKRPNRLLCETHIAWRGSVLPAAHMGACNLCDCHCIAPVQVFQNEGAAVLGCLQIPVCRRFVCLAVSAHSV